MASTRDEHDLLHASSHAEREEQRKNDLLDFIVESKRGVDRAAIVGEKSPQNEFYGYEQSSVPSKFSAEEANKAPIAFPEFKMHDLGSIYCTSPNDPTVVWNHVTQFVNDDDHHKIDSEVNEEAKVVYGNFYQDSSNCTFMASVARLQEQKDCVVDVRRLSGNAFLLKNFFDLLKQELVNAGLVQADDDDDFDFEDGDAYDDYDDLFASDDDGDDEDGLQLELPDLDPHRTMMEFEYDPHFLHMMINGFSDTHMEEKNYFMGLLSHNATRPENRSLMLGAEVRDQMKDLIQQQLQQRRDYSNASLTRDTCVLLKNLACEMEIDDETVKAASKAAGEWCPGKNNGRIGELQGSKQALFEISEFLEKLCDDENYPQYTEAHLLEIIRESLTEEEIKRITEFKLTTSRSLDIFDALEAECN